MREANEHAWHRRERGTSTSDHSGRPLPSPELPGRGGGPRGELVYAIGSWLPPPGSTHHSPCIPPECVALAATERRWRDGLGPYIMISTLYRNIITLGASE